MILNPKIIFRVDANKEIGWGHVKRCQALATKCCLHGHEALFAGAIDKVSSELLAGSNMKCQYIEADTNSEEDLVYFLEVCKKFQADIVIIDTYDISSQYSQRILDEGYFVVSIHDTGMPTQASHVTINANLNAENIHYDVTEKTTILLGIKYLLMPQEYWEYRHEEADLAEVKDILITMGSSDPNDLTTRILKILNVIKESFRITVIIGPHFDNEEKISDQAGKMEKKVRLIKSPPSLFPYIKESSIGVSSAGQTLYQLATLGRPTIGISQAENQMGHLKELSRMKVLIGLNYNEDKEFSQHLENSISQLVTDFSLRSQLSKTANKLVDGQGTERVYLGIVKAYKDQPLSYSISN